jgi:hypothetical protein
VLDKSIATVIGPTHPGTGVIEFQAAKSSSYFASQNILPSTTENQTSIITASGFTISGVIRST